MDRVEKQEFSSPLPVLPRLDRLDRLLQFLEAKHSLSARHGSNFIDRETEAEDRCQPLSSALEEVHHKGTLMERLEMLENRVLQLRLETMDVENTSGSSSSTILGPEDVGQEEISTVLMTNDKHMTIPYKEKQESSLIAHEIICTGQACVRNPKPYTKITTHKMRHRKWPRWLSMGC